MRLFSFRVDRAMRAAMGSPSLHGKAARSVTLRAASVFSKYAVPHPLNRS